MSVVNETGWWGLGQGKVELWLEEDDTDGNWSCKTCFCIILTLWYSAGIYVCKDMIQNSRMHVRLSIVAYMLKVGSAWTDITRLCELQELLKPFSFNNRSMMTIHDNEIGNSIGDGKGRMSGKSTLFQQLIRRGRSSILLLHKGKKPIKAIDLHFLNQLCVTIFFLILLFRCTIIFLGNPFSDTRKISMFCCSMIRKRVRATKIICPIAFDALDMVFASAGELDIIAKKQIQFPDCIIEFLRIIATIYVFDRN